MPFKFKHVLKAPAKVFREVAKPLADSGIFGVRHDTFRVAGIPIGKDLVPVVTTGVAVAAAVVGAPVLASTMAIPTTTAAVVIGAGSSATIVGVMGADTSEISKAALIGGATSLIGNASAAASDLTSAVAIHIGGNTAVALASGTDMKTSLIQTIASVPGIIAPTNVAVKYVSGAVGGALLDDNALRGALQGTAIKATGDIINNLANDSKSSPTSADDKSNPEPIDDKPKAMGIEKPKSTSTDASKSQSIDASKSTSIDTKPKPASIINESNDTLPSDTQIKSSITAKSSGVCVTVGGQNAPMQTMVSKNSVGVVSAQSKTSYSSVSLGVGDIYENGIMIEKQTTVKTSGQSHEGVKVQSEIAKHVVSENIGQCIATRTVISSSASNNVSSPQISTTTSNQVHFNVDCAKNAAAAAVISAGVIALPEVTGPVLIVNKLVNN